MGSRIRSGSRCAAWAVVTSITPVVGCFAPIREAHGALSYWDANGLNAGAGSATPAGTWGTDSFWSPSPAGTASTSAWTPGDTAVFSAGTNATGTFTVTLSAPQSAGGVLFEEGNITLAGASLSTPVFNTAAGLTETVTAPLTPSGGLTKSGAGTLIVANSANAYSGGTTIGAGTLRLGANGALGVGAISVGAGQLALNGFNQSATDLTLGDGLSSTAASVSGSGALTLSGNITFNPNPDSTTPTATLASNVQLTVGNHTLANIDPNLSDSFYDMIITGAISGAGGITKSGSFYVITNAAHSYTGPTNVNNGVLLLAATNSLPSTTALSVAAGAEVWLYAPFAAPGIVIGSYDQSIGSLSGSGNISPLDATLTVGSDNTSTTFSGTLGDAGSLVKIGLGTLTLDGVNTYTGATTVSGGTLQVAAALIGTSDVTVQNNSTLELKASSGAVLAADTLTVNDTSRLNLQDNKMIFDIAFEGTWDGSAYTDIAGLIQTGRNGGAWNGAGGIVTSQTQATTSNYTSIGVATASDIRPATATATDLWDGQTISGSDTLVMYTYGGDANLDGKINIDDYIRIDNGVANGLTGWSNGDFNYDGVVNIDDYTQFIDANIGTQGAPYSTAAGILGGALPLPEPGGTLAVVSILLFRHCRRSRRSSLDPACRARRK